MSSRMWIAVMVGIACLVAGGLTYSQEARRKVLRATDELAVPADVRPPSGKREKPGTLERRVQDLEQQVRSLTRELDALRKEMNSRTDQMPRVKPVNHSQRIESLVHRY